MNEINEAEIFSELRRLANESALRNSNRRSDPH